MAITTSVHYDPMTHELLSAPKRVTSFVGRVIRVFQKDYRAMSDIYTFATFAEVWDDVLEAPKVVLVNSNFELDTNDGRAEVDATPEILQKVETRKERLRQEQIQAAREAEAKRIVVGKRVVVVKGRKVKQGTQGIVFWMRDGRVGLDVSGKKDARGFVVDPVWVTESNLSVCNI